MRTLNQQLRYEQLELVTQPTRLSQIPLEKIASILSHVWQLTIKQLTRGHEPRILQSSDQTGNTYWTIYDPVSHERVTMASEDEVRRWLETRYYR